MALIKVAPARGRKLLNHQRDYRDIPDSGEIVLDDPTFRRRIADGDALLVPIDDTPLTNISPPPVAADH